MSEELKPCPFCGAPCRDGNFLHSPTCAINYFQNGVKVPDAVWNRRHIPEGYALIKLDSVLVPLGEPMPQTVEAWQYLGHQCEKELLANRDEIAALKAKVNDLTQKLGDRHDLVKEGARLKQEGEKLREDYNFFMAAFIEENRRLKAQLEKLTDAATEVIDSRSAIGLADNRYAVSMSALSRLSHSRPRDAGKEAS